MKAAVGDELVIESAHEGEARRVGVIVELRNEDGSPPYVVRWLHVEQETLVFPGPRRACDAQSRRHGSRQSSRHGSPTLTG